MRQYNKWDGCWKVDSYGIALKCVWPRPLVRFVSKPLVCLYTPPLWFKAVAAKGARDVRLWWIWDACVFDRGQWSTRWWQVWWELHRHRWSWQENHNHKNYCEGQPVHFPRLSCALLPVWCGSPCKLRRQCQLDVWSSWIAPWKTATPETGNNEEGSSKRARTGPDSGSGSTRSDAR